MQSGISASQTLHDAFSSFLSDTSLFALPITIQSESLVPLDTVSTSSSLSSSLDLLKPHLQPKTPIYLLLRLPDQQLLTAVTYVPSNSPVRSKTLFASTRSSLVRELGAEKFGDTVFVTEVEEVVNVKAWEERQGSGRTGGAGVDGGAGGGTADGAGGVLSAEERELQSVKRAEEEERHGTGGRALNIGSGGGGGMKMKMTPDAEEALQGYEGGLVQFGIDVKTEMVELLGSDANATAKQVRIPGDRPSYSFFRQGETTLFVYVCPGTAKVKERMVAASSRNGIIEMARGHGIEVSKKIEASEADEVTAARIEEDLGPSENADAAGGVRQGFARPKRPGRRW